MGSLAPELEEHLIPVMASILSDICVSNDQRPATFISKFHASSVPPISVRDYIQRIHHYSECSPSALVLAMVYLDRLQVRPDFYVCSLNVHRLLMTACMLAAKFIDDHFYNNAFWSHRRRGAHGVELAGARVSLRRRLSAPRPRVGLRAVRGRDCAPQLRGCSACPERGRRHRRRGHRVGRRCLRYRCSHRRDRRCSCVALVPSVAGSFRRSGHAAHRTHLQLRCVGHRCSRCGSAHARGACVRSIRSRAVLRVLRADGLQCIGDLRRRDRRPRQHSNRHHRSGSSQACQSHAAAAGRSQDAHATEHAR